MIKIISIIFSLAYYLSPQVLSHYSCNIKKLKEFYMPITSTYNQNDRQTSAAERAVHSAEDKAQNMTDKVEGAIKSASSVIRDQSDKLIHEARDYAETGAKKVKETYHDVEDSLSEQSDALVNYIKEHPIKSALIAVGAGYLLSYLHKK